MHISTRFSGLRLICWMIALVLCVFAHRVQAQAVPSAMSTGHALWVGGEFSDEHAGFPYQSSQRLWGGGVFADFRLNVHLSVAAEARFLHFNSFYGETENHYLAGPPYNFGKWNKLQPFAQFLVGDGQIQFPFGIGTGNYLAVAPGAGVNYRLSNRWALRGEYDYQFWPNSPDVAGEPSHEIKPNGFHMGVAYRLTR